MALQTWLFCFVPFGITATLPCVLQGDERQVIEEVVWNFSERVVNEPIQVTRTSKPLADDSVEHAAFDQFLRMIDGDLVAWSEGWDSKSKIELGIKDGVGNLTAKASTFIETWKTLKSCRIYLVAIAATPDFSIVAYEIHQNKSDVKIGERKRNVQFDESGVIRNRVCFRREDGMWCQTNEFSEHPLLLLWWSGQEKMSRVGTFVKNNISN